MKRIQAGLIVALTLGWSAAVGAQAPRFPQPQPRYRVRVDSSVTVPMRDGVSLSTDLYLPSGAGERFPVVLIRTPYNKKPYRREGSGAHPFSGPGYAVAGAGDRRR